ncbi:MAG: hypothetical protein JW953_07270 [Anaerolineae bacterium]|nr:hypothetical protein [Anaerolineae bacterium]
MTKSPITSKLKSSTSHLLVLAAYFLLTVLMTWPTVLHLTDGIPGDGFDGWQNYWNLWWSKEAALVLGQSPYFTDYLYPPAGTNLLFHTLNIFNFGWTLPLQLNIGLAVAYNSIVFFSFVFAGYGGYLLSLHTLSQWRPPGPKGLRPAAFGGGLVFTMSPFHLAHLLGHMQVFSMVWPPFYVLWLLRTLKPWAASPPPRYAPRDVALTTLFLVLATLVDWYHTLYLLIFTGLVLLWLWGRRLPALRNKNTKEPAQNQTKDLGYAPSALLFHPLWIVLLIGFGFALVLSPLLIPMIQEANVRPDLETGLAQNITLSADLLAFVLPSEMHPLWGRWAAGIAHNFSSTTSERLIFAGFVPLALGLFIIIRRWVSHIVKFWLLVSATFFILALGPYLHLMGKVVSVGHWPLPMPYLLLYKTIPFIGLTRSLSRYDLMVMLGLGVLVALALAHLSNRPAKSRFALFVSRFSTPLAILLICVEFLPAPYPVSKIEVPQLYFDLATQTEDYVIAELPMNWDRPTPLLHQTVHHKRLLTAYTSRDHPLDLARRTPVFQQWRYLGPDIITQPLEVIAPTIFADYNLRYIVLDYWQMPPGPERNGTEQWVAVALPGVAPVYADDRLKVYQAPPKTGCQPYLTLGTGWSEPQKNEAGPFRVLSTRPESPPQLFLHHPQQQTFILAITAAAPITQKLILFVEAEPAGQFTVTQTYSTWAVDLPPLAGDVVALTFKADDPGSQIAVSRIGLQTKEGQGDWQ